MAQDLSLQLSQTQKLAMTPELRQAIYILQLNAYELGQYLNDQVLSNPLLEFIDPPWEEPAGIGPADRLPDWLDSLPDRMEYAGEAPIRDDRESDPLAFASRPATLIESLTRQYRMMVSDPETLRLGLAIIDSLDERGYLGVALSEILHQYRVHPALGEKVLRLVQSLEPAGVAARDLAECLMLQLQSLGELTPLTRAVVDGHLEDIAAGRLLKIAHDLGISMAEAESVADLIRSLDPKPGSAVGGMEGNRYILPDLFVEKVMGDYVVIVNDTASPRLRLSPFYQQVLREAQEGEAGKYVKEHLSRALWLIKSVEQRRLTLQRITEAVVDLQHDFFEFGIEALKPLTLQQVASVVGVHESTVSRATGSKYAQTPRGLFSLKFFFTSGVMSQGGEIAAESVQRLIRDLVTAEDSLHPLSDQGLVESLKERGVYLSRRTVTKYREAAQIPSSLQRRRYSNR
jgi:RNA polymerase sigma-54 factor